LASEIAEHSRQVEPLDAGIVRAAAAARHRRCQSCVHVLQVQDGITRRTCNPLFRGDCFVRTWFLASQHAYEAAVRGPHRLYPVEQWFLDLDGARIQCVDEGRRPNALTSARLSIVEIPLSIASHRSSQSAVDSQYGGLHLLTGNIARHS